MSYNESVVRTHTKEVINQFFDFLKDEYKKDKENYNAKDLICIALKEFEKIYKEILLEEKVLSQVEFYKIIKNINHIFFWNDRKLLFSFADNEKELDYYNLHLAYVRE